VSAIDNEDLIEQWRPVIGYELTYEVSSHGRVRSLARTWVTGASKGVITLTPRILKAATLKNGYMRVDLSIQGKAKHMSVHRLVCHAFNGDPKPNEVARHMNGRKSDNHFRNLAWGSYSQNNGDDKRQQGTIMVGIRHHKAKLCDAQVLEIRRMAKTMPRRDVAAMFGVCKGTIARIAANKTWRHI
jgi:hypothetical protein